MYDHFGMIHAIVFRQWKTPSPQSEATVPSIKISLEDIMTMLTTWKPFGQMWREMGRFHRDVDRLMGRFGVNLRRLPTVAAAYPALNVWQDADAVYADAELPGLNLEDLEIYVTGTDQLAIKGNRKPLDI